MTQTMAESETHAWYALRRTLPTWSFEENLAELVECLPRYGVDEVIVKVDTEEFSHDQPPLAWVEAYQPRLHRVREAMEALGIVYSLNPWITLGHCDRGRGAAPVLVNGGVYPLAFAKDCGNGALLGLFNLTLDPWPEVEFCLAGERRARSCEVLTGDGAWKPASAVSVDAGGGITTIRCATEIAHDTPLFVYVRWE